MNGTGNVMQRELTGYFETPVAYVFLIIFLAMTGIFAFYLGNFYERGFADLDSFFRFHPWLYLFLVPAISMRLWAEERRSGTIELLLTLPLTTRQAVLGKSPRADGTACRRTACGPLAIRPDRSVTLAHSALSGTEMKRRTGTPPCSVSGKLRAGGAAVSSPAVSSCAGVSAPSGGGGEMAWGITTVMGSEKRGPRAGSVASTACTAAK